MSRDRSETLFSLSGRRALVTGASRGIGATLAIGLAESGAHVMVTGRDPIGLGRTLDAITAIAGTGAQLVCDLTEVDLQAVISQSADALGGLDVLVNNAGIHVSGKASEISPAQWHQSQRMNVDVPFALSQAAGSIFCDQHHGKVINITSTMSLVGGRFVSPYVTSKHGLLGLTRALALEWAGDNVQVNALAPGAVRTEMLEGSSRSRQEQWLLERTPAGRLAEPADLVGPTVFLASAASDYITGQTIVVDGGWTVQ